MSGENWFKESMAPWGLGDQLRGASGTGDERMDRVRVGRWLGMVVVVAMVAGGCVLQAPPGEEDGFRDLYTNEPEPLRWVPGGERDDTLFPGGVQVLDATSAGALVSGRSGAGEVEMVLMRGEGGRWEEVEVRPGLVPAESGAVHLELMDLDADMPYSVAFFTPDRGARSAVTRFRTAPAAEGARVLRFGATSCLGGANRPWPNLSRAAEAGLDFMLLAGDTVYADGSETVEDFRAVWGEAFAEEGFGDLSSATSLLATWDDHEIRNNWSFSRPGEEGLFNNARTAFHEALPWRGETLWRRLSWGKTLEVFVLDSRGERREGDYISTAQMEWLKGALLESEARFKLILNSVPITDMSPFYGDLSKEDRWQGFSDQRAELLNFIDETALIGVFFVSGDFHFGQVARVSEPGEPGSLLWEILVGPSGSMINPLVYLSPEIDDQFSLFVREHNYTYFEADPKAGTLLVRYIGDQGEVIAERLLSP